MPAQKLKPGVELTTMDVEKILRECYRQKELLERTIDLLEELLSSESPKPSKRRGRKNMGAEERREVSERMKKYWANRRKTT